MTDSLILTLILGLMLLGQVFDWILTWLNLRAHTHTVPAELAGEVDADKYARSRDYHREHTRFGYFASAVNFVLTFSFLALGGFGWLDGLLRQVTEQAILLPLLFFGVLFVASDLIATPFSWYRAFVIEEKYGFNRRTPLVYWTDKLKGYALAILIGGAVAGMLLWLVEVLGQSFWVWFWIFLSGFTLLMNVFYTTWLLPIFNKLRPLEEGSLRSAIEDYASKVGFPLHNIMVLDGSKRSTKANAFFSGLGRRKKVVLYDTLMEQHSEEELVAVLAHEIGHYKKRHIYQGLVMSVLQSGLMLFVFSRMVLSPTLSAALGSSLHAVHLNIIAFGLLYSPISMVLGILGNVISRKNEFEADRFAAETYAATPLRKALLHLHTQNLSNATPHPWYVFVNYSHPPLIQRLRALKLPTAS